MIPYDLDPSLHTTRPEPMMLDDGFSPPLQPAAAEEEQPPQAQDLPAVDHALWAKSPF
jgi:hypothetical protein